MQLHATYIQSLIFSEIYYIASKTTNFEALQRWSFHCGNKIQGNAQEKLSRDHFLLLNIALSKNYIG